MPSFVEFLRGRLDQQGFTTEDALVAFLPLVRQTMDAHAAGTVAPLEGVGALHVEEGRIWFEQGARANPRSNSAALRRIDAEPRTGLDITAVHRRTLDAASGEEKDEDLRIHTGNTELSSPAYLPSYVTWEHRLGHHDPLTDVFSLGMILASLACGLDFCDEDDLRLFVQSRENLFKLCRGLHPVLAKAITGMTELSRNRRAADLARILRSLENYRNFDVDFEYDIKQVEDFEAHGKNDRQRIILTKLQERLFELSRRNRLLHFQPAMGFLNLTQSSVPLSFDVSRIDPARILTWGGRFRDRVLSGAPVCLNDFMNFDEVLYLAPILDRIRTEAIQDEAEFGFSQVKLAICFLHWADLKSDPPEIYDSPLLLLPVKLTRKKGVRDTYWLEVTGETIEINPVIRHQFRRLYDIAVPTEIDLSADSVNELFNQLVRMVGASDRTVDLRKVERPRVELLHDKARRKLDSYRRRARVTGRGVRLFLDIDYSYDSANFHPLGLQIFSRRIRPSVSRLEEIARERPAPRRFIAPEQVEQDAVEKEKLFYAMRERGGDNPHAWEFDLCSVTLGNFKYRRMSLVRDYEEILADNITNDAFDAAFSLSAPPDNAPPPPLPLADRHQVVACDPTQASAIAFARTGRSYIIQGPPGTGKSQTITNLIADFVARGKRVLFVCEKRAAIDVVHARLKERGIADLCCLIHDSQADKKQFVMDLKDVSERFHSTKPDGWHSRRRRLLAEFDREMASLQEYAKESGAPNDLAGMSPRDLIRIAVELLDSVPALQPTEQERLPHYAEWFANRKAVARLLDLLRDLPCEGILAKHPLASLNPGVANRQEPLHWLTARVETCGKMLDTLRRGLRDAAIPPEFYDTSGALTTLLEFASPAAALVDRNLYALLDPTSDLSRRFDAMVAVWRAKRATLDEAVSRTPHWRKKLPREELDTALDQARQREGRIFSLLFASWRRLRKALDACYDFAAHTVRPTYVRVLENLKAELDAADEERKSGAGLAAEFRLPSGAAGWIERVDTLRSAVKALPENLAQWHRSMLADPAATRPLAIVAPLCARWRELAPLLQELFGTHEHRTLDDLSRILSLTGESLATLPDFLQCLAQVGALPDRLADAFRSLPLHPRQIEAAIAHRTANELLRRSTALRRFSAAAREKQTARLDLLYRMWQDANAQTVRESVLLAYRDLCRLSAAPAAQLTEDALRLKEVFNTGRRELAHEFGKQMRFKAIRDLATADTGAVIRAIKPVWLMSPLSVSDTLPLDTEPFDVVIFDEASQITLEEAVPAVFRGRQIIVVGDEMQLPPTNFFSARGADEDEICAFRDDDGDAVEYDLSANSFLNHVARNLPSIMLGWHYRSRSESLISFSNCAFYRGRLLTVPEEDRHDRGLPELAAKSPVDAAQNARELLDRAVSFHFVSNGVYDNRRNRPEADYIAHLVRELIRSPNRKSIGIVAFSEAQQGEIERALDRLAGDDATFRSELEAEYEREDNGQFAGLLVRNLENIQGDERDIVIMSVCYGFDPDGRMIMNFGPINQAGGEKRLNVAFSRARHHMALVSSIRGDAIRNEYNDGARCLRNYLRYAAACSVNDLDAVRTILSELSVRDDAQDEHFAHRHPVAMQIKAHLERVGYEVDLDVGLSRFRCDLAVRKSKGAVYSLGIMLDTDHYYAQTDPLERDLLKPNLLRAFGWKLTSVLAQDYWLDRDGVLRSTRGLLEDDAKETSDDALNEYRKHLDALLAAATHADDAVGPAGSASAGSAPDAQRPGIEEGLLPAEGAYLEYVEGSSSKFWEITLSDNRFSVRFGRIGTAGQEQTKTFPDAAAARREAIELCRSKLAKGYKEKTRPGGTPG